MRYLYLPILILILGTGLHGQAQENIVEGTVSYVTSQSVYVKFISTGGISSEDTLFIRKEGILVPALVVRQLSSISCVCDPLVPGSLSAGDKVYFLKPAPVEVQEEVKQPAEVITAAITPTVSDTTKAEEVPSGPGQQIAGRVSVSSYSNFSNTEGGNSQRMRYTFSLDARRIAETKLSAEAYISFVHRSGQWQQIKDNIFNGLKIYSFAFRYDFNEKTRTLLGRKINPRISSLGAVDGLQFERDIKSFTIGLFAGSRPDYRDYSVDLSLFQFGAYVSHEYRGLNGTMQSTLAFVDQYNAWNTDRRFIYFQHANALVKNLYFFGSAEMDLYTVADSTPQNTFNLTNLYLMLRYRPVRQLSVSLSYSARNNIIYYETYKDILERLLETETLQGFRAQIIIRPVRKLSIGIMGNYRYRKQDPRPAQNVYGYVTYSQIPVLNISATISATWLETGYISGKIYSAGITRDLFHGRMQAGLNYRYVDYSFYTSELPLVQNYAEASLNWRVYKKLSFSVFYEGAFEKKNTFNRVYINLTQRF